MEDNGNKVVGAHVLINCETDQKDTLLDKIGAIENVTEIIDVVGSYDIITKINAYNTKSLMLTIRNELEKIVNINSAITLIHTDLEDPGKTKSKIISQNDEKVLKKAMQELDNDNFNHFEIESIESIGNNTCVVANTGFLEIAMDIDNKKGHLISKEKIARE